MDIVEDSVFLPLLTLKGSAVAIFDSFRDVCKVGNFEINISQLYISAYIGIARILREGARAHGARVHQSYV
jgi:hypothetical protein